MSAIQTKPEPHCPLDGARMILRKPPPGASWRAFWGCMNYPECKGTRVIGSDGRAESDDVDWEDVLDKERDDGREA